jgi:TrpR-related protein YerC/YecD
MARHHSKLSGKEVEKIFYQLCLAISRTKNVNTASKFLRDMLSYQESEMIAKRLKIAELILEGETYSAIRSVLKVSPGTIARVQEWLKISGDGYRWAIQQTKKDMKKVNSEVVERSDFSSWGQIKRRYPMYFWPELLLEDIIKGSNERQKKKIKNVMKELEKSKQKTELFQRINRLLHNPQQIVK